MFLPYGSVLVYALYESAKIFSPKNSRSNNYCGEYISCPVLMASQNWDDHDRSGKYTATAIKLP
jgi:hypothetical protein